PGTLLFQTLSVNASGGTNPGEFQGGTIDISSGRNIDLNFTSMFLLANGSSDGAGGSISLVAPRINVNISNPTAAQLQVIGAGTGKGGTVTLSATQSNLTVGNVPGGFQVFATGGSVGSAAGDGGTLKMTARTGIDIDTDPLALQLNPLGNGTGAQITLKVTNGPLGVSGDLRADGGGFGAGGKITIDVKSSAPFSIGNGDANSGVSGVISANGGPDSGMANDGGTVDITQRGSGGILFGNQSGNHLISVKGAAGGGAGGSITIDTGS